MMRKPYRISINTTLDAHACLSDTVILYYRCLVAEGDNCSCHILKNCIINYILHIASHRNKSSYNYVQNKPQMERARLNKLIQHKIITIRYIYESCFGRNVYRDCSSSYLERAVLLLPMYTKSTLI